MLTKGQATRQIIVEQTREIFNVHGVDLTLRELAERMGVGVSRITNHFPTKAELFVALSEEYDEHFAALVASSAPVDRVSLTSMMKFLDKAMDLQYEHRCLMLFVCSITSSHEAMLAQIAEKWRRNLPAFGRRLQSMVQAKLLHPQVLEERHTEILRFQYINLLTTWLVSYTLYDAGRPLDEMKRIYLIGTIGVFYPYLTAKGKREFNQLLETAIG